MTDASKAARARAAEITKGWIGAGSVFVDPRKPERGTVLEQRIAQALDEARGAALDGLPQRGDAGLAEATRDPIFLFQTRYYELTSEGWPLGLDYDGDGYVLDGEPLEDQEVRERFPDHFGEHWRTERVFFTRDEATSWAERRTYRWPDGWRVYCVCAEGDLAALLKARSAHPTGNLKTAKGGGE